MKVFFSGKDPVTGCEKIAECTYTEALENLQDYGKPVIVTVCKGKELQYEKATFIYDNERGILLRKF